MKNISQEYILDTAMKHSINREELLIKKYQENLDKLNNKELKRMMKEFKSDSREHVKLISEMMINLNLQD